MSKPGIVPTVLAVACSLAVASCTRGPASITGTYVVDVPPGGQAFVANIGQWRMTLAPDGTYVSTLGEKARIEGTYRVDADRIVLADAAGAGNCSVYGNDHATGAYRYAFEGDLLTLVVEHDECRPRREVLANYPLRRVD
jgi:hypothetical protein